MDRRHFTQLMLLAPLVLAFRPRVPERFDLCCAICGKRMGHIAAGMKVVREGRTLCEAHSGLRNRRGKPIGLIEGYHIAEVRRVLEAI